MQDFQALTVKYNGRTNVLFSEVGVSKPFDLQDTANHSPIINTRAIWDTGASCTVITKELAAQIGLVPTGKTTITGVNHETEENTYLVNIYLPNKVCFMFVKIAEVPALTGGASLLIGMDIIGSGDFSVFTENWNTVMSYRYPSVGGMDFVTEAGNVRAHKAVLEKLDHERKTRTISNKLKKKHKQERMNKNKGRKKKNKQ